MVIGYSFVANEDAFAIEMELEIVMMKLNRVFMFQSRIPKRKLFYVHNFYLSNAVCEFLNNTVDKRLELYLVYRWGYQHVCVYMFFIPRVKPHLL
jgi:hypothetical protein